MTCPGGCIGGGGQPRYTNNEVRQARINAIYRDLAQVPKVAFVDAAAAAENPDGTFAHDLPCAPYESTCDPSGRNVVRSDDGVHFCPGLHTQPCPAYSSGAYRFAWMITLALADPASYDALAAS